MASAEKKYNESRMRRSDRIKQIFALVSIVSFGGSEIIGIVMEHPDFVNFLKKQWQYNSFRGISTVFLQIRDAPDCKSVRQRFERLAPAKGSVGGSFSGILAGGEGTGI